MPEQSDPPFTHQDADIGPGMQQQPRANQVRFWTARTLNRTFLASQILRERIGSRRSLKILFSSRTILQPRIARGFKYSRHEIAFAGFSPDNVSDFDVLVPLNLRDTRYLNTIRPLIEHSRIPIPSSESIELCDDKLRFNEAIASNGFRELIPTTGRELPFPYIVKKRIDESSHHSFRVTNAHQAEAIAALRADPDYISQEMVVGVDEYATHLLIQDGEVVHAVTVKYTFGVEVPIKGKDKSLYTRICASAYLDVFAAVLRSINYEGLCCVNYKVSDNRPMILEINPRFGSSLSSYFVCFMQHLH